MKKVYLIILIILLLILVGMFCILNNKQNKVFKRQNNNLEESQSELVTELNENIENIKISRVKSQLINGEYNLKLNVTADKCIKNIYDITNENIDLTENNQVGNNFIIDFNSKNISKHKIKVVMASGEEFIEDYNIESFEVDGKEYIFEINTSEDMVKFRDSVNKGNDYLGVEVNLINDIDMSIVCSETLGSWIPIGTEETPFRGEFNGNGKNIYNIYINNSKNYQGLYGVAENSKIKNLKIQGNVETNNSTCVGLLAGEVSSSTIENVVIESDSNIHGSTYVGGLIGFGSSVSISRVINYGNIQGSNCVGGIIGHGNDSTTINESANEKNTTVLATNGMVGGISGARSIITSCFNKGNITGNGDDGTGYTSVGGIQGGRRFYD